MQASRFSSGIAARIGASLLCLAIWTGAARATPTVYDITGTYSGGDASGTLSGSFTLDPSSAAGSCGGSPDYTCSWDLTATATFSTTGTYDITVGGAGDPSAYGIYQQTLWSAPNPTYTEETYIAIADPGVAGLQLAIFPGFTDPQVASVPLGSFTDGDSSGTRGLLNVGGTFTSVDYTIAAAPVPEPGTLALLALPLGGLAVAYRRRRGGAGAPVG